MNRFDQNLEVIKLLKSNVSFQQYTGFGGLHKIMQSQDYTKLEKLLTADEFKSVKDSVKSAYYTPVEIINFIYQAIIKLGFKGGRILEPSCGHGAFLFNMPYELIKSSHTVGIECEALAYKIARITSPFANVFNGYFQNVKYKENSFDLIVGNPPYSSQKINDSVNQEFNGWVIHHYFVARAIKLLKKGGLLAFVLPQFSLDNKIHSARPYMVENGSLIAAYRLPDCLFDNAKITVDIVIYQKGSSNYNQFANLHKTTIDGHRLDINEYFAANPENIIGTLKAKLLYGERMALTVQNDLPREEIYNQLFTKLADIPSNIIQSAKPVEENNITQNQLCKLDNHINKLNRQIEIETCQFTLVNLNSELNKYLEFKKLLLQTQQEKSKYLDAVQAINDKQLSLTNFLKNL